jgi:branched-chain amino acid transport system ATP-binding protein
MRPIELDVNEMSGGYDGARVVEDLSFRVGPGQRLGIIGRNGAGKTTTLACIMGLAPLLSGRISFGGNDIGSLPVYRRARAGIGYVPQTRNIFGSLTVEENLLAALPARGGPDLLAFAYDLFPRIKERRRNSGGQLSGGEQQMLAVARTLVTDPSVILLDEPLEGLAPRVRETLLEAIIRLMAETGLGCIIVEQCIDEVLEFATDVLVLERGRCAFYGSSVALKEQPALLEQAIGLGRR